MNLCKTTPWEECAGHYCLTSIMSICSELCKLLKNNDEDRIPIIVAGFVVGGVLLLITLMKMFEIFSDFIKKNNLLNPNREALLTCSTEQLPPIAKQAANTMFSICSDIPFFAEHDIKSPLGEVLNGAKHELIRQELKLGRGRTS